MNKMILAGAGLLAAAAATTPMLAWSAGDDPAGAASGPSAGPAGPPRGAAMAGMRPDMGGMGPGMRGEMRQAMQRSPGEACKEHLARKAGFVAYVGAKLNLTAEQKPLWDKLQATVQSGLDSRRQLCDALTSAADRRQETMLDRLGRQEKMLANRLQSLQQTEPALQALYQTLSAEQKAIIDHPFRHG